MSFGDHVETRSELEAAELDRENRVSDRLLTNERPDGDSHWASVVIDDAFEPRELTEAESVLLYESGIGIDVERMWIRPGLQKGPTAINEDTGEVTPYGEALPPLQDSERSRRAGLRGSGPRPQNSETIIPSQQVKHRHTCEACGKAANTFRPLVRTDGGWRCPTEKCKSGTCEIRVTYHDPEEEN